MLAAPPAAASPQPPPGGASSPLASPGPVVAVLTVDLEDGSAATLDVRLGDSPRALAEAFVARHALPPDVAEPLEAHVADNQAKGAAKLAAARRTSSPAASPAPVLPSPPAQQRQPRHAGTPHAGLELGAFSPPAEAAAAPPPPPRQPPLHIRLHSEAQDRERRRQALVEQLLAAQREAYWAQRAALKRAAATAAGPAPAARAARGRSLGAAAAPGEATRGARVPSRSASAAPGRRLRPRSAHAGGFTGDGPAPGDDAPGAVRAAAPSSGSPHASASRLMYDAGMAALTKRDAALRVLRAQLQARADGAWACALCGAPNAHDAPVCTNEAKRGRAVAPASAAAAAAHATRMCGAPRPAEGGAHRSRLSSEHAPALAGARGAAAAAAATPGVGAADGGRRGAANHAGGFNEYITAQIARYHEQRRRREAEAEQRAAAAAAALPFRPAVNPHSEALVNRRRRQQQQASSPPVAPAQIAAAAPPLQQWTFQPNIHIDVLAERAEARGRSRSRTSHGRVGGGPQRRLAPAAAATASASPPPRSSSTSAGPRRLARPSLSPAAIKLAAARQQQGAGPGATFARLAVARQPVRAADRAPPRSRGARDDDEEGDEDEEAQQQRSLMQQPSLLDTSALSFCDVPILSLCDPRAEHAQPATATAAPCVPGVVDAGARYAAARMERQAARAAEIDADARRKHAGAASERLLWAMRRRGCAVLFMRLLGCMHEEEGRGGEAEGDDNAGKWQALDQQQRSNEAAVDRRPPASPEAAAPSWTPPVPPADRLAHALASVSCRLAEEALTGAAVVAAVLMPTFSSTLTEVALVLAAGGSGGGAPRQRWRARRADESTSAVPAAVVGPQEHQMGAAARRRQLADAVAYEAALEEAAASDMAQRVLDTAHVSDAALLRALGVPSGPCAGPVPDGVAALQQLAALVSASLHRLRRSAAAAAAHPDDARVGCLISFEQFCALTGKALEEAAGGPSLYLTARRAKARALLALCAAPPPVAQVPAAKLRPVTAPADASLVPGLPFARLHADAALQAARRREREVAALRDILVAHPFMPQPVSSLRAPPPATAPRRRSRSAASRRHHRHDGGDGEDLAARARAVIADSAHFLRQAAAQPATELHDYQQRRVHPQPPAIATEPARAAEVATSATGGGLGGGRVEGLGPSVAAGSPHAAPLGASSSPRDASASRWPARLTLPRRADQGATPASCGGASDSLGGALSALSLQALSERIERILASDPSSLESRA